METVCQALFSALPSIYISPCHLHAGEHDSWVPTSKRIFPDEDSNVLVMPSYGYLPVWTSKPFCAGV